MRFLFSSRKPSTWRRLGKGALLIALAAVCGLSPGVGSLLACGPFLPEQILTSRRAALRTPVGHFAQEVVALTEADDHAPALPAGLTRLPRPGFRREAYGEISVEPPPDRSETERAELREALEHYAVPADRRDALTVAYQLFRDELDKAASERGRWGDESAEGARFDSRAEAIRKAAQPAASPAPAAAPSPSPSPAPEAAPTETADADAKPPFDPAPLAGGGIVVPRPLADGLPGEFADYLEGAARFWSNDLRGARTAWERLLARPKEQRLYRSVWAAYMLARMAALASTPEQNARRYQGIRDLRAAGFRDLLNLAPASLGWEARLAFDRQDWGAAARLYYLQGVTGGDSDLDAVSLRMTASGAMGADEADPAAMAASARDPFLRRAVTLYVACSRSFDDPSDPAQQTPDVQEQMHKYRQREELWLAALSGAGVDAVREAAVIAWAAYQEGDYAQAAAWTAKAPEEDGLALWLRAKLALRDGKPDAAAGFFAKAVRFYPAEPALETEYDYFSARAADARAFRTRQFHADWGTIQLSRGDFAQALTSLLRSGFWRDAAYVAERVMTADELRDYVRANFPKAPSVRESSPTPTPTPPEAGSEEAQADPPPTPTQRLAERLHADAGLADDSVAYSLRYLLARRLSRAARYADAREFYPAALLPKFDEYAAARKLGESPGKPKAQRADALWRAAKIERWLGMEIVGTENDPDWFVEEGQFDMEDHYREARLDLPQPKPPDEEPPDASAEKPSPSPAYVPPVGREEKRRMAKKLPPDKRFHYRYIAADLSWQAAALMPDQQEATAKVLASGGQWLESVHQSRAADRFYAAILRRCGQTEIGRTAAKIGRVPKVPREEP
jgi:hypothetical protein